jgi:tRNA(Ile)-lysidine synthetase-like protein
MTTEIRDFWFSNPEYWFATGPIQVKADTEIYEKFKNYDYKSNDLLGQVIYLDQFIRHFSRLEQISEETIIESRKQAATTVKLINLKTVSENELIWYLMPWKHLQEWHPIFYTIEEWLQDTKLTDHPLLNRFFMDTYKKAYTQTTVSSKIILSTTKKSYSPDLICDSYPIQSDWGIGPINDMLIKPLNFKECVTVSLSGGIDSMLMTALLSKTNNVIAAHIVYGNRPESAHECGFIQDYCRQLNVPLYIYTIEWLRRDSVDRAFYEEMTRSIRFNVYKALNRPALLGHIQEDVIENIWTNLARGTHLNDLAKLTYKTVENGVTILRPWLHVKKQTIYLSAHALNIPYLKNTTPNWSNRGKFRKHFYEATKQQYGDIDSTLIEVSERYKKQAALLDKLLFNKINNSWNPETRQIDITAALEAELEADGWQRILTDLSHNKLSIGKPTLAACEDFASRVKRGLKNNQLICLSKLLHVKIIKEDIRVFLGV